MKNNSPLPSQKDYKEPKAENAEGYPLYPPSEDIYSKFVEEEEIDPEDITKKKQPVDNDSVENSLEDDFEEIVPGNGLDVPGSDLDDSQEQTGNEDEENNYYSVGGDNHIDLEENKED